MSPNGKSSSAAANPSIRPTPVGKHLPRLLPAIAHLAHSTPAELLFTTTDFNSYMTVSTADGAPRRINGRMAASVLPGLGITPKPEVMGKVVVEIG